MDAKLCIYLHQNMDLGSIAHSNLLYHSCPQRFAIGPTKNTASIFGTPDHMVLSSASVALS